MRVSQFVRLHADLVRASPHCSNSSRDSCHAKSKGSNPTCALQTDSSEELYEKTEKVVADIKEKWDKTEEKPALIGLVTASIVLLYVLNGIVSAVDKIPVISGMFELIGIFVSSWFVYRYLVFGPGTPACNLCLSTHVLQTDWSYSKVCRPPGVKGERPGFL